ncbi:MAG: SH3 domain-containing protein [Lachnospiraceae bacterium]|nr:SH3 domain-containing protein [Lachnospiraceae bacterium]
MTEYIKRREQAVKWRGRCLLLLLLFSATMLIAGFSSHASTSGVVSGATSLNIRSGPGTSYDNITASDGSGITLPNGYSVTILEEADDEEDEELIWYKVSFTYDGSVHEGYALSNYIKPRTTAVTSPDFEAYLEEQAFPESYRENLRILHTEHPTWIFEALHTGLDWTEALDAESEVGKNLIQNHVISSWKSMEDGAYDWNTNKWVVFDGSDWVAASGELIAYYMDPRNFLDDVNVFQFETLSYDNSYQSIEGVQNILNNSFMSGTYTDTDGWTATYAEAFIYAAEQSGVSPYHLASRALQELGTQGSASVSGTVSGYEGYFNFYNIGATSSSNPVRNGLAFAQQYNDEYFLPWNVKWKAIAGGAVYLGRRYINVGQDTLYLQKFNVQGNNPYTHQYMTNVQAPSSEAKKMAIAYGDAADLGIVFKIPVYENMPESASELPTGTGGSVTTLSRLEIAGFSLTPTFNKSITEYDLVLTEPVTDIAVNAEAADSSSSVSGTGIYVLSEGLNVISITVTAQNGSSTTYTVNVVAPTGPSTYNGGNFTVSAGNNLFMDLQTQDSKITVLYGFDVGITVEEAMAQLSSTNCGIRIVGADRQENTGKIATGNILQITANINGEVIKEIPIVIYGDINGDGEINGKDMLYMQRHILGISALSGVYAEAADINWDDRTDSSDGVKLSTISAKDMLYLQRHLLDVKYISQK